MFQKKLDLVRYMPTSVHVSCVLTMVNVDFMLGQRGRRLTYINPPLSIPQRKHDRSTPAQCFPNVGPMSQTMDQR